VTLVNSEYWFIIEKKEKNIHYTNFSVGLCSLTTGVVFSFQSSMTFTDKQQ